MIALASRRAAIPPPHARRVQTGRRTSWSRVKNHDGALKNRRPAFYDGGSVVSEPATSTATTAAAGVASVAMIWPGVPASVVIGAFAGGLIFFVLSEDFGWKRKTVLLIASFTAGVLGADSLSRIIEKMVSIDSFEPAVSAFMIAAVAVHLMLAVFARLKRPDALSSIPRRLIDDGGGDYDYPRDPARPYSDEEPPP